MTFACVHTAWKSLGWVTKTFEKQENIIWSAPSQKNLFNVFQRKLWLVVHKQQPCSECRRWFWPVCLVTWTWSWTWLLTSPWSIWEHQGSCSSYLPAAGPALKPGEPEHCEFLMENLCISYSPHPCLLNCIKTSIDIFHGEIETGLQSQKILH